MQAPSSKGVCGYATQFNVVEVSLQQSLDDAINTKLNKEWMEPRVTIVMNTTLNRSVEMAGVILEGVLSSETPVILVASPVTLNIIYNSKNAERTTLISNVEFNIITSTMAISLVNGVGCPHSELIINNCFFQYKASLGAPLIVVDGFDGIDFIDMSVVKSAVKRLNNVEVLGNICDVYTDGPVLLVKNSVGRIASSSFRNVDRGVIVVDNSQVSLESVEFVNNAIIRISEFPNLRHNVYILNNSTVTAVDLRPDTKPSNFIYIKDNTSIINNINIPLFLPKLISALQTDVVYLGEREFLLGGDGFYPCGLSVGVFKGGPENRVFV
jgi:hypothetical protein